MPSVSDTQIVSEMASWNIVHLLLIAFSLVLMANGAPCPEGYNLEKVNNTAMSEYCYGLVNISKGPMTYDEAVSECIKFDEAELVVIYRGVNGFLS